MSRNTVSLNGSDGIRTAGVSNVPGTTASATGQAGNGYGLNLGFSATAYSGNVVENASTATRGTVFDGTYAGPNICNGSLTCP